VRGGAVSAARATTLAAKNVHDVNSFERPDVVKPAAAAVAGRGAVLTYRFPPASVTKLELTLG